MNLPDMSDVLTAWEQPVLIKTVTNTTVDFEPVIVVAGRTQNCVVQVADKESLQLDTINWALEYLLVHSKAGVEMSELVEYKGKDFIVVKRGPWTDYGYTEVIAEETKRTLVEVTP